MEKDNGMVATEIFMSSCFLALPVNNKQSFFWNCFFLEK